MYHLETEEECAKAASRSYMFFKTGVNSFAIFTGKRLGWSLFENFIKKRLQHNCFPVNIATFLGKFFYIEHLWWLLLIAVKKKDAEFKEQFLWIPSLK